MGIQQQGVLHLQPQLFALAYRMTGEIAVSEDIVQESITNWVTHPNEHVQDPQAYLAKSVINRSLNHLAAIKRQREAYKGTWLPEPIVQTDTHRIEAAIDVSYGLLLATLTPTERAVFLLKESFEIAYVELASQLSLTQANCRQLFHRARQKLATPQKRFPVDPEQQYSLVQAFVAASHTDNIDALVRLLNQDIVIYADGGGKATAALRPFVGLAQVTAFLKGLVQKGWHLGISPLVWVNGKWGLLLFNANTGQLDSVVSIQTDEVGISHLYFVRNPDKLLRYKHWGG